MNVPAAELALAAARTRLLGERLGADERDKLVEAWGELLEDIEFSRSAGAAELALISFRADIEARLAKVRRA